MRSWNSRGGVGGGRIAYISADSKGFSDDCISDLVILLRWLDAARPLLPVATKYPLAQCRLGWSDRRSVFFDPGHVELFRRPPPLRYSLSLDHPDVCGLHLSMRIDPRDGDLDHLEPGLPPRGRPETAHGRGIAGDGRRAFLDPAARAAAAFAPAAAA